MLTCRQRNFGFMSILGFSCTLMVTWEGMFWYAVLNSPNLIDPGGLTAFAVSSYTASLTVDQRVWCMVISFVGSVTLRSLYL